MKLNTLIIAIAIVLIVTLLTARFYFSEESYGITNPSWNGISQLSSDYEVLNLNDLADLSIMGQGTTLLIIGPSEKYSVEDSSQVQAFLEREGKVVILDDYGTSNTLLGNIGSPVILNQIPLCQLDNYYVRSSFPIIKNITSAGSRYQISGLVLNHPVSLTVSGDATVLATTSRQGWLDNGENGSYDDGNIWGGEQFGVYPVAASASVGKGQIVVVSDADIGTNGMLDKSNNRQFISALIKGETVYIDMTHGHAVPPLVWLYETIKYDLAAQVSSVIAILLIGYAYYKRADIVKLVRRRPIEEEVYMDSKESMISYMRSKLPLDEDELKEINKKL